MMDAQINLPTLLPANKPGDHLNVKMSSYRYRDPLVKDKTVSQMSYL